MDHYEHHRQQRPLRIVHPGDQSAETVGQFIDRLRLTDDHLVHVGGESDELFVAFFLAQGLQNGVILVSGSRADIFRQKNRKPVPDLILRTVTDGLEFKFRAVCA